MAGKNHHPQLPRIEHLGGEHGVTGSCHLLQGNGINLLVDCGLPQGSETMRSIEDWPVQPAQIDYIFLTHAHVDHTGRLPVLIKLGFKGEILTTHPTQQMIIPMLQDAMGFPEMQPEETEELIQTVDARTWGFEFGQTFELKNGIRFQFKRAGHILGSSFIHLESDRPPWSVLFSGDLGAGWEPFVAGPEPPDPCDLLVLESTYGDILHEDRPPRVERFGAVLQHCLEKGGKVLIPTFALGRAQMLIHDLHRLATDPVLRDKFPGVDLNERIPVFVDSPLGPAVTDIYQRLCAFWQNQGAAESANGENPLDLKHLYAAASTRSHEDLLETAGPHIIMAGSGMCDGGRIIDHLKMGIEDPRNNIIFLSYQAKGTPGRTILMRGNRPDGAVALQGQNYAIRAGVHAITGYSAHADQWEIMAWLASMPEKPGSIKLVHGERPARAALAEHLMSKGYKVAGD